MTNNTTDITVFKPDNISQIVALGPSAFDHNTVSHDRCLTAGRQLLERIARDGMNDALDLEVARFIEKSKATVVKMNTNRSPVTKLFDEIRSVFTSLENDVDPRKSSSIPGQLQQCRDKYAAKKRAEAEAKRLEEARRQAVEMARSRYRNDLEEAYKSRLNALIVEKLNALSALDAALTVAGYDDIAAKIKAFDVNINVNAWMSTLYTGVRTPVELTPDVVSDIESNVRLSLAPRFAEQYRFEVESYRDDILDRLPSKLSELKRIEAANAEEAARIKAEMEARERAEAARKEQERLAREAEAKAQAELEAKKNEMDGLFDMAQLQKAEYQPKTAVRKRLVPLKSEAFLSIIGFWWSNEGQNMSVEELSKNLKKMVTFCEKAANDKSNPVFITDDNIIYEDEIKAK